MVQGLEQQPGTPRRLGSASPFGFYFGQTSWKGRVVHQVGGAAVVGVMVDVGVGEHQPGPEATDNCHHVPLVGFVVRKKAVAHAQIFAHRQAQQLRSSLGFFVAQVGRAAGAQLAAGEVHHAHAAAGGQRYPSN